MRRRRRRSRASGIVQTKSATSGWSKAGRVRAERVVAGAEPGQRRPCRSRPAIRCRRRAGREQDQRQRGAFEPGRLDQDHGGDDRRVEESEIAAKRAARRPSPSATWAGRPAQRADREDPEPAAERDQGCLRAEDERRGRSSRTRRAITPGQFDRLRGARVFSPSAGTWPPTPGSRTIANATIRPAIASDRQRPPRRAPRRSRVLREVGEDADLDLVDELEERPGGERDDDADHRRQDEQAEELACSPCSGPALSRECSCLRLGELVVGDEALLAHLTQARQLHDGGVFVLV